MFWFRQKTYECTLTGKSFAPSQLELDLLQQFDIPRPVLAPEERMRRLLAFESPGFLYWRNCDATGIQVFSAFPPSAPFPVHALDHWQPSMARSLARSYDSGRPLLEQLFAIWKAVPRPARYSIRETASDATHCVSDAVHCFSVLDGTNIDHCLYCVDIENCRRCIDCYSVSDSELCGECINCHSCERLRFSEHCTQCSDSWFLSHCDNCRHCLFCSNLSGEEYCVFNRQVSAAEFAQTLENYHFTARPIVESALNAFGTLTKSEPVPNEISWDSSEALGNYLLRCSDADQAFLCRDCSSVAHAARLVGAQTCLEVVGAGFDLTNSARLVRCGFSARRLLGCVNCFDEVSDLTYCIDCHRSQHLLACVGLQDAQYCILNQQYSPDDYAVLAADIERQLRDERVWGMPLPPAFSSFTYEESLAGLCMPLSPVQAEVMGFRVDSSKSAPRLAGLVAEADSDGRLDEVPQTLEELASRDLSRCVFVCELSGEPFQMSLAEVDLYRELQIAPPARAFPQRHISRLRRFSPYRLDFRKSDLSGRRIVSAFPPQWHRPVWDADEWQRYLHRTL